MKIYEKKVEPAREHQVLIKRTCDICGQETKNNPGWDTGNVFEIEETEISITVKYRGGVVYPECAKGYEYEIDLCPRCFTGKLLPWLHEQGASIEEEEWGW